QDGEILHHGRKSLMEIDDQLELCLIRSTLNDNFCVQVSVLVRLVWRSVWFLSNIFKTRETAELVRVVEEQTHICLSVLRVITKVIAGKSSDAEEIASNVTQWLNDTQPFPFRESSQVYSDRATERYRRKITRQHDAIGYQALVILHALPSLLDEINPGTKNERMLARNDREQARMSPSESALLARQRRVEELGQERESRIQDIKSYIDGLPSPKRSLIVTIRVPDRGDR
ncbi:unnamed protein product, partial [Clonostachys byssicola]